MSETKLEKSSRKSRWALILGLSAALVAVSGAALADKGKDKGHRGGRGGHFPGAMVLRAFGDLDLTEQQELQAIRIRRSLQEQAQAERKEMAGTLAKIAGELEKPNPDATKIHGIADEVFKRVQKLTHSAIDQMLALHQTLTPEQRATLTERMRGFGQHVEGKGGKGEQDLWRSKK